jgi:hypothetical protein
VLEPLQGAVFGRMASRSMEIAVVLSVVAPHTREKLNTPELTFPLDLPVYLLYLSVVCKPVQIFPCVGWLRGCCW